MRAIFIGSGAVWLVVALYVWVTRGEMATIIPVAATAALLVCASVWPKKETWKLQNLEQFAILIFLVGGAFFYADSLASFIKWVITVAIILLTKLISSSPEERQEAGIVIGPEHET